jgi:hypothetical protein
MKLRFYQHMWLHRIWRQFQWALGHLGTENMDCPDLKPTQNVASLGFGRWHTMTLKSEDFYLHHTDHRCPEDPRSHAVFWDPKSGWWRYVGHVGIVGKAGFVTMDSPKIHWFVTIFPHFPHWNYNCSIFVLYFLNFSHMFSTCAMFP